MPLKTYPNVGRWFYRPLRVRGGAWRAQIGLRQWNGSIKWRVIGLPMISRANALAHAMAHAEKQNRIDAVDKRQA